MKITDEMLTNHIQELEYYVCVNEELQKMLCALKTVQRKRREIVISKLIERSGEILAQEKAPWNKPL